MLSALPLKFCCGIYPQRAVLPLPPNNSNAQINLALAFTGKIIFVNQFILFSVRLSSVIEMSIAGTDRSGKFLITDRDTNCKDQTSNEGLDDLYKFLGICCPCPLEIL